MSARSPAVGGWCGRVQRGCRRFWPRASALPGGAQAWVQRAGAAIMPSILTPGATRPKQVQEPARHAVLRADGGAAQRAAGRGEAAPQGQEVCARARWVGGWAAVGLAGQGAGEHGRVRCCSSGGWDSCPDRSLPGPIPHHPLTAPALVPPALPPPAACLPQPASRRTSRSCWRSPAWAVGPATW